MVRIESIAIYPLKSGAGLAVDRANLTARGFEHDRRWMLIDPSNQFVTARTLPKLLSIQSTATETGLRLRLPQHGLAGSQRWFEAEVPRSDANIPTTTTVWSRATPIWSMGQSTICYQIIWAPMCV